MKYSRYIFVILVLLAFTTLGAQTTNDTITISPNFNSQSLQRAIQQKSETEEVSVLPQRESVVPEIHYHSPSPTFMDRIFFGGNFGLDFIRDNSDRYSQLQIAPLVGSYITPNFSMGAQFIYEYSYYTQSYSESRVYTQGWGVGIFARYDIPSNFLQIVGYDAFIHGEYNFMSYSRHQTHQRSGTTYYNYNQLLLGVGTYAYYDGRTGLYCTLLWDFLHLDEQDAIIPIVRIGFMF